MIPRRIAHKLLHSLIVALGHISLDSLDVLTTLRPQQSAQIVTRMLVHIVAPDDEVMLEHLAPIHELPRHRPHADCVIFFKAAPGAALN